jgi:hypothetical protein
MAVGCRHGLYRKCVTPPSLMKAFYVTGREPFHTLQVQVRCCYYTPAGQVITPLESNTILTVLQGAWLPQNSGTVDMVGRFEFNSICQSQ